MNRKRSSKSDDSPRRDFFRQLALELARPVVEFKRGYEEGRPAPPSDRWLRPPSVEDDDAFLRTCDRSGECVSACPADAVFAHPKDGSPYIDPEAQPCVVCVDLACMSACPSGGSRSAGADGAGDGRRSDRPWRVRPVQRSRLRGVRPRLSAA